MFDLFGLLCEQVVHELEFIDLIGPLAPHSGHMVTLFIQGGASEALRHIHKRMLRLHRLPNDHPIIPTDGVEALSHAEGSIVPL